MYRDLEKGVYLFIQTHSTHIGDQVYQSEPFIITVPGCYDGQIIWDVTAEPKFKNESIPPITPNTPPVTEKPAGGGNNSSHTTNVKAGDEPGKFLPEEKSSAPASGILFWEIVVPQSANKRYKPSFPETEEYI